ncbi:uncharacterized protein [Amphiura filiformis]|uniref:uncharacterized protein n=1 Tax=Amphiura filiformis TaxID=82378 RepID=UPI003B214C29
MASGNGDQITRGMQFRRALLQISKQLSESEVEEMKFLIAGLPDKPGFAELEPMKAGRDVFMLLMKRGDISEENYYLLGFLLDEIGQKALIKRFKQLLSAVDTSMTPSDSDSSRNSSISSPGNTSVGASPISPDPGYVSQSHLQTPNVSGSNSPQPQATSTPNSSTPPTPKYNAASTPPTAKYDDGSVKRKIHQIPPDASTHTASGPPNQSHRPPGSKSSYLSDQNSSHTAAPGDSLYPGPGSSSSPSPDGSQASNQVSSQSHSYHGSRYSRQLSGQRSSHSNKPASQNLHNLQLHNAMMPTPKSTKQEMKVPTHKSQPLAGAKVISSTQKVPDSQQMPNYQQRKLAFSEDPVKAKPQPTQAQAPSPHTADNSSNASPADLQSSSNKVTGEHSNPVKQRTQAQSSTCGKSPDVQHQGASPSAPSAKVPQLQQVVNQQEYSHPGSFGFRTLRSVEVPLTGSTSRTADLLDGMPHPSSSNLGPTIEPPSDSLPDPSQVPDDGESLNKEAVAGNAPRLHATGVPHPDKVDPTTKQSSAFAEQKTSRGSTTTTTDGMKDRKSPKKQGTPDSTGQSSGIGSAGKMDQNLEEQMGKLNLDNQQGQGVIQREQVIKETILPSDDLETDAPDEDEGNTTSIKARKDGNTISMNAACTSQKLSSIESLWSSPAPGDKHLGLERSSSAVPPGFSGANITPMKDGSHRSLERDGTCSSAGDLQHSSLSLTSVFPLDPAARDKAVFDIFAPNPPSGNLSPVGYPGHSINPRGARITEAKPSASNQVMNVLLGHNTVPGSSTYVDNPMLPSSTEIKNKAVLPPQMGQQVQHSPSLTSYNSNSPYMSQAVSHDGNRTHHHESVPTSARSNQSQSSQNLPLRASDSSYGAKPKMPHHAPGTEHNISVRQPHQRSSLEDATSQVEYSNYSRDAPGTMYHRSSSDNMMSYSRERSPNSLMTGYQTPEQSLQHPYQQLTHQQHTQHLGSNPKVQNYGTNMISTPLDHKMSSSTLDPSGSEPTHTQGMHVAQSGRSHYNLGANYDVRKKNVPALSPSRTGANVQYRREEYRSVRDTDVGDSALVLPKSSHGAQSSYAYQQQQKQPSPRKSKSLDEIKRRAADSIAQHDSKSTKSKLAPKSYEVEAGEDLLHFGKKSLRKYQEELAAPAKTGDNYIICAPTGSGKTLTAASICLHLYEQAKARGNGFKALFIVNIRHLTQQQTASFNETFPAGTVGTIGETEQLRAVFFEPDYAVVMVTAQILVNALRKTPMPDLHLQDISLIIFDECHHTTQDHPYNEVMKRYLKEKKLKLDARREVGKSGPYLPQIIGLSASLGVGHGKDAFRHVLTLCSNMDAKNVIQVHEHKDELDRHVNSPEQDIILYCLGRHEAKRDLWDIICNIMTMIESQLWTETPSHATQKYEQWVVNTRQEAEVNSDQNRILACLYLFEYNRALLLYEDLRAVDAFIHLENFMKNRYVGHNLEPIEDLCRESFRADREEMKRISMEESDSHNPKLLKLAQLLKQKFTEKPHSKGIVLTRMRLGTMALENFIKETRILHGLPCRVKPIRLVGQGETDNFFMTESQQKQALDLFRKDESFNLLVATDIAQEGLDMPACNFVIRYNFVSNEIGTVQSKGRARAEQSECFLIVEQGSQNASRELENRQKVVNMQEAMQKLNDLQDDKRIQDITKRQDEIYEEMEKKDTMTKIKRGIHQPDAVDILCKECNMHITWGSYMRKKGCHYTCVDPEIKHKVRIVKYRSPQVYRDTQNIGNFKCGNPSCGQQLGVAILFLEGNQITHNGYGFKVQSFLFKLPDASKRTFKQWKKVTFDIPDM